MKKTPNCSQWQHWYWDHWVDCTPFEAAYLLTHPNIKASVRLI